MDRDRDWDWNLLPNRGLRIAHLASPTCRYSQGFEKDLSARQSDRDILLTRPNNLTSGATLRYNQSIGTLFL